jgi:aromatic ring hydroxylase
MVVTPYKPQGAMTGERYIESLRDGREVWIDGKRVDDVTTHPAFRDMIRALPEPHQSAPRLRPGRRHRAH